MASLETPQCFPERGEKVMGCLFCQTRPLGDHSMCSGICNIRSLGHSLAAIKLYGQSPITQVRAASGLKTFHFSRRILM